MICPILSRSIGLLLKFVIIILVAIYPTVRSQDIIKPQHDLLILSAWRDDVSMLVLLVAILRTYYNQAIITSQQDLLIFSD